MPTYNAKPRRNAFGLAYAPTVIFTVRNKFGKYRPHIGAKESAKFVARRQREGSEA